MEVVTTVYDLTSDKSEPSISTQSNPKPYPQWTRIKRNRQQLKWKGVDRHDGKYRLYQTVPGYFPGKIRRQHRRGKLMTSFDRIKLIKIAWKTGVANPESFDRSDCDILGLTDKQGFHCFVNGWTGTNKPTLIQYIWNHLYDSDNIITV